MKFNFKTIALLFFFALGSFSCEDPVEDTGQPGEPGNGWDHNLDQDTGQQSINLNALFFDFEKPLSYTYNYHSVQKFEGTEDTVEDPCRFNDEDGIITDTLVFSTFPNYLLEAENCSGDLCDELGISATSDYINHSPLDERYGAASYGCNLDSYCSSNENLPQEECDAGDWVEPSNELCYNWSLEDEADYDNEIDCESAGYSWITEFDNETTCTLVEARWIGVGYNCDCYCLRSNGQVTDCDNWNLVEEVIYEYNGEEISGACQNNSYTTESECISYGWLWFDFTASYCFDFTNDINLTDQENIQTEEECIQYFDDLSADDDPDNDDDDIQWWTDEVAGSQLCRSLDVNRDGILRPDSRIGLINEKQAEFSEVWRDVHGLYWDAVNSKYSNTLSSQQNVSLELYDDTDEYDTFNLWSILNGWEDIEGMVFIDHSEWIDTAITYYELDDNNDPLLKIIDGQLEWTEKYVSHNLHFRINSDCNNDGIYTSAEIFYDTGLDGCYDDRESGYVVDADGDFIDELSFTCLEEGQECQINSVNDSDGDQVCDDDPNGDNFILVDEDGDGIYESDNGGTEGNQLYDWNKGTGEKENWDDTNDNLPHDEIFFDINDDGIFDPSNEPFVDLNCNLTRDVIDGGIVGNGIWDDDEGFQNLNENYFTDEDGNEKPLWDQDYDNGLGEPLYIISSAPNQLILNYDEDGDGIIDDEPTIITNIDSYCSSDNNNNGIVDGTDAAVDGTIIESLCLEIGACYDCTDINNDNKCDYFFIDQNDDGIYDEDEEELTDSDDPNGQIVICSECTICNCNSGIDFDEISDQTRSSCIEENYVWDSEDIWASDNNSITVYHNGGYKVFNDIINTIDYSKEKAFFYNLIERIDTVWSNRIIEDVPVDLINEYHVTKTRWDVSDDAFDHDNNPDTEDRYYDYDYHLFRYADSNYLHEDLDDVNLMGSLMKLYHPSYFNHYGFWEDPDDIEEEFYEISDLIEEVSIFAPGGVIQAGHYAYSPVDTINVPDNNTQWLVQKDFDVELESVSAPFRQVLGEIIFEEEEFEDFIDCNEDLLCEGDEGWNPDEDGNGIWDWTDLDGNGICNNDEQDADGNIILECEDFDDENGNGVWDWIDTNGDGVWNDGLGNDCEYGNMIKCFSGDQVESCVENPLENECGVEIDEVQYCSPDTIYNAFKITRTKTLTMVGNDIDFGERNTIWLVDKLTSDLNEGGIIKDKLEMRWTEDWFSDGSEQWTEFSRLELRSASIGETSTLGRMLNQKYIGINDFQNEPDFDNDRLKFKPTAIIQRIRTLDE